MSLDQVAMRTDHQRWRTDLDQEFDPLTAMGKLNTHPPR